jgi:hypothetical protein
MHFGKPYSVVLATMGTISLFGPLADAQQPTPAPFMAHQLKPNVYWIEGGGGNSGVIVGEKGVIVVDAKTTRREERNCWTTSPKSPPSRSLW